MLAIFFPHVAASTVAAICGAAIKKKKNPAYSHYHYTIDDRALIVRSYLVKSRWLRVS